MFVYMSVQVMLNIHIYTYVNVKYIFVCKFDGEKFKHSIHILELKDCTTCIQAPLM